MCWEGGFFEKANYEINVPLPSNNYNDVKTPFLLLICDLCIYDVSDISS